MSAAVAAIQVALKDECGDGLQFLRYWHEGEFNILRRNWPDAPEAVYIGADPALCVQVKNGESWALIAHSTMSGGAGGILAASSDICALIEAGGMQDVFVFPDDGSQAGIYLWHGVFDPEESDFTGPPATMIDWPEAQLWLIRHGEQP
jgi:hypothetical protein